jgi:hypothetical protein
MVQVLEENSKTNVETNEIEKICVDFEHDILIKA